MASINILHASDLHICVHNQLRSPIDRFHDLENPWNTSLSGVTEKLRLVPDFALAWWKKMAASSYDPETLQALAEFIYNNSRSKLDEAGKEIFETGENKLDAVVFTGDLATTGSYDDIKLVANFLRSSSSPKCPYKSADKYYRGPTLSAVKIPILCLPGNHDRFIGLHDFHRKLPIVFQPGSEEFDKQLTDYRSSRLRELELSTSVAHDKTLRVVVMAIDFTLEDLYDCKGDFGWLAQGRAYTDRRKLLGDRADELQKTKRDDEYLCIIWAMHFPPRFPHYPDHSRLLGEENVIRAANRTGVRAIIAGHTHEQSTYRNPGMDFWVYCCGTTTQYQPLAKTQIDGERGNFFQIITVTCDTNGQIDISGKDYRYGDAGAGNNFPRLMQWLPFS
jgi:3',5'-cyclic AMP phosphodiesterase CpdA